jgi:hypothetical protein
VRRSVVGCYFPRDPRSTSLAAKAHGRVGMAIKALQLALSVSYALKHTFGLHVRLVSSGCELAGTASGTACVWVAASYV